MAKTVVEKLASSKPDVSIFKISGVLGYHENEVLKKFFDECRKKGIVKLVLDFSDLSSMGGGCAKVVREAASNTALRICVVGASATVQSFLEKAGKTRIAYEPDVESAVNFFGASRLGKAASSSALARETATVAPSPDKGAQAAAVAVESEPEHRPEPILPADAPSAKSKPASPATAKVADSKQLERRLVQYRSLFSLSSDFSRIQDKTRLLDAFLLTTIALAGTESAAFLERSGEYFRLVAWKGFETANAATFSLRVEDVGEAVWMETPRVFRVDEATHVNDSTRQKLKSWSMPFVAPFVIYNELQGLVLLGNPIRKDFDQATFDYLSILINQAAIAYQNSMRLEQESKRTLGLVQSLVSMIEENTLARGNTESIANHVHAVAIALHYPEENVKDLVYGTVLRDIGMIKVSDLIVRSPRELEVEEWEIIKQHPIEGAEMLRKMNFSEHTLKVVLCHHERFNGRGYPNGTNGTQIPLGARIVAVVESYAAMLQDRPTRPALSSEAALNTLKENWGTRYDPEVITKFAEIVEEEIRTGRTLKYRGSELFRG
jgi:anti-anti-sigma regulatory factor